jgi:predicted GNAT family acetyltransferase
MALTDKTGAPVTVHEETDKFTVAVEGRSVGLAAFADRGRQRVFFHTEVDDAFGGRGLASVLIGEALARTKAEGMRIVPVCPMVIAFVRKHPQDGDVVDRPTPQIMAWLRHA